MLDLATAIILATTGQILLSQHDLRGLILYALAISMLLIALFRESSLSGSKIAPNRYHRFRNLVYSPPLRGRAEEGYSPRSRAEGDRGWRLLLLPLALTTAVLALLSASDNTYRWYGVLAWLLTIVLFLVIFWERDSGRPLWRKLGLTRDGWRLRWTVLAIIGLILVGFWFRFWRLAELPLEMTSDHVEKLLDVHDLTTGQRPIFFVRNTGREPWQFYWTLMFIRLFDLETKFFALKLGTAVVGLLTLPGVYLLGRHLFGRWVGLWATLFTAVASWPVILSRIGLRFAFAPAATAWSLFYLLRGLRDGRRNDFLLLGLWLGIGLHGYTSFRAMPLAVVACWLICLSVGRFRSSLLALHPAPLLRNALLTVVIATVVFIPLGRFSLEHPDDFWRRSVSRIVDPAQSSTDSPLATLLKNLGNLARMFHWRGDDVWVNTLSHRPVLDPLLGGLLILGLVIVLWRCLRLRDPIAPLLLIAGIVLLLPSALSLAYPIENPSVVRTGGAIPVVMTIAALPVGLGLEHGLKTLHNWRRGVLALSALALAIAVTTINYQRYFDDYWKQCQRNALNTTEVASAIQGFVESGGDPANAWIVAWPHWLDTRGVGIELGDPTWDNVILDTQENDDNIMPHLQHYTPEPHPYLYVLHPDDQKTLEQLRALFPQGWPSLYISTRPLRDFVLFYVPPDSPAGSEPTGGWSNLKGTVAHAH